jgi:hypothetical protein
MNGGNEYPTRNDLIQGRKAVFDRNPDGGDRFRVGDARGYEATGRSGVVVGLIRGGLLGPSRLVACSTPPPELKRTGS